MNYDRGMCIFNNTSYGRRCAPNSSKSSADSALDWLELGHAYSWTDKMSIEKS